MGRRKKTLGKKAEMRPWALTERMEQPILLIGGQRAMLDPDLTKLYGVTIKRLREQVRRSRDHFPEGFHVSAYGR